MTILLPTNFLQRGLSPKLATKGPQRGPVELMCPSVRLYIYISVCLIDHVAFWISFVLPVEFKLTKVIYIYMYIYNKPL